MRDINRAERLLSLFTSPDSAAGIVGDLSEERGQRGRAWLWRQVLGTVLSLCRGALVEAPVVVVTLLALGLVLQVASAVGVVTAWPHLVHALTDGAEKFGIIVAVVLLLLTETLAWWTSAFLTGSALVAISGKRGMAACALLAIIVAVPLLAFELNMILQTLRIGSPSIWPVVWILVLAGPIFLFVGGATVRRRQITNWGCAAQGQ